jgi:hypothetical protein
MEAHGSMTDWTQLMVTLQAWYTTAWRHARAAAGFPPQLRCREVVDLLLPYVEQTLDPQTRHAVARHMADCVHCGRFLETYRATMALGHQLRDEAMPPEVRARLEKFVQHRLARPS